MYEVSQVSEVQGELSPLELLMKAWHKKPLTRGKSSVLSLKKREEMGK